MNPFVKIKNNFKQKLSAFNMLDAKSKKMHVIDRLLNNALAIILVIFIVVVIILRPNFLSVANITNIINNSAYNLILALGVAGIIVLTGTDLSAGRVVGLTAVISISLLQASGGTNELFPNLNLPWIVPLILVIIVGGVIGGINGFFVAKFKLHPFIVTLASALMVYALIQMYLNMGNGGSIGSPVDSYYDLIMGSITILGFRIYNYVFYVIAITIIMWLIWNKTKLGKNMFAIGSNEEAAKVAGVNVFVTIICVFAMAGVLYGISGFITSARLTSAASTTGDGNELKAIAACVIGGVSFTGGVGKIRGVIMGVVLLVLIDAATVFLDLNSTMVTLIQGIIILLAVTLDMRKHLVKR